MSKLLEKLTFTRRKILASLNCSFQLLISKTNEFVTIWIRVTEIILIRVSNNI